MFVDAGRNHRRAVAWAVALALAAVPRPAAAQPARDPAAADALYKAGRALLAKGDWDGACAKFEASMSLDPAASTLINIGKCHEHYGRLASAWSEYQRGVVLNQDTLGAERKKTLADLLQRAIAALEPRLPRLRIVISERPPGLRVTRGGVEVPAAALGDAIPADPGEVTVEATAPGHSPDRRTVTLVEGKTEEITLRLAPGATPAEPPGPARGAALPGDTGETPAAKPSSGGVPTWAWIAGGAGIALVGAGVAFRVDGLAAERTLDEQCGEERVCDPASGYDPAGDNARKNRDFVLFVALGGVGVAAIGAAVIGIVTAGPAGDAAPAAPVKAGAWVAPGAFGASIGGVY
jgi:hypothetical protein